MAGLWTYSLTGSILLKVHSELFEMNGNGIFSLYSGCVIPYRVSPIDIYTLRYLTIIKWNRNDGSTSVLSFSDYFGQII